MIEFKDVTKRYGSLEAVSHLSFTAEKTQILGLLGQNGAGKTTTLNILTGYFPPTSGTVTIDGLDMLTQGRECRRLIGYLPERPPLYDEMTVRDYLAFVCRLREVRENKIRPHIAGIMELCGLEDMDRRLVGTLSKGYRQRVGMAQALCGDPPVLILDEPTVGLDPRQVVEIRDLIRKAGESRTVVFSSHTLSEVQQLCSRVLILHHGRLASEADLTALGKTDTAVFRLTVLGDPGQVMPALRSLPCVRRLKRIPGREKGEGVVCVRLECATDGEEMPQLPLFRLVTALDTPILSLERESRSLEEMFLRATEE